MPESMGILAVEDTGWSVEVTSSPAAFVHKAVAERMWSHLRGRSEGSRTDDRR
jgi:hypothetical protein